MYVLTLSQEHSLTPPRGPFKFTIFGMRRSLKDGQVVMDWTQTRGDEVISTDTLRMSIITYTDVMRMNDQMYADFVNLCALGNEAFDDGT